MPILKITSKRNYSSWDSRPWMQKKMMDAAPNHRNAVRLARDLGVKLMVGCIYPGPGDRWVCGEGTSFEMMELQDCGLSPMEILMAATKYNAEGYGKGSEIGTLEPGKQADIVLLDQNPLEDISALHDRNNICTVFCDGRRVYDRNWQKE
jgi:imidazolonepropionase-like amidohydrolase